MNKKKPIQALKPLPLEKKESYLFFTGYYLQLSVVLLLAFGLYFNSVYNTFALDDGIVINTNDYVKQGLSGIPKILSTDAYDSFYTQMASKQQLSGGRYRPLSIVTFAIEREFFGEQNWFFLHLFNVLFFTLSMGVLFVLLKNYILKDYPDVAFLATLIFTIHPIHTEAIANVKSRDEILSFLFIALTFIYAIKYHQQNKIKKNLYLALTFYFLAFLSKEYAITLLLLLPATFYLLNIYTLPKSFKATFPFIAVAALYMFIRIKIVGFSHIENPEVLNNPYIFASKSQKWATKIATLSEYLKLLFFPKNLSSDYSYNQIPYKNFGNLIVWISFAIHLFLAWATIKLFKKKHILSFALLFYLGFLSMVCNLLLDIGATMGERLIYHASLGFCIGIAYVIIYTLDKLNTSINTKKVILLILTIAITSLLGIKTVARNADWESDITLFLKDVETVPNSVLANGNAGARYIDISEKPENKAKEKEYVDKAIFHLNKALKLHPRYVNGYLNLGIAYFKLKDYNKAEECWNKAKSIYPTNPNLRTFFPLLCEQYLSQGFEYSKQNNYQAAIKVIERAVRIDPNNPKYLYNLGGAYYTIQRFDIAEQIWAKTLQIDPNFKDAQNGLNAIRQLKK